MKLKEETIEEVNKFLKGIHMGGTTFKDYLEKAQSQSLKEELRLIVESFKRHEEAITHRIEALGGNAADSVGIMGMMGEFFEKIKMIPVDTDKEVLEHGINAMDMGIENANKFLEEHKDLEPSLIKDIEGVVKDYDNHLRKLKEM
ncbi:DUF2383 domain-containing protein [Clostridium paraputrificum]|uniref:DUF2383 domain-containing protein n=1 Tax=Clostridium paraputrificum TaxID=29363 RepID=UPI003D32601F